MLRKIVSGIVFVVVIAAVWLGFQYGVRLVPEDSPQPAAADKPGVGADKEPVEQLAAQPAGEIVTEIDLGGGAVLKQGEADWELLMPEPVSAGTTSQASANELAVLPAGEAVTEIELGGGAVLRLSEADWELVMPQSAHSNLSARSAYEPIRAIDLGAGYTLVPDQAGYRILAPVQAAAGNAASAPTRIDIGSGHTLVCQAGMCSLEMAAP